jgi:hypothetical protein
MKIIINNIDCYHVIAKVYNHFDFINNLFHHL